MGCSRICLHIFATSGVGATKSILQRTSVAALRQYQGRGRGKGFALQSGDDYELCVNGFQNSAGRRQPRVVNSKLSYIGQVQQEPACG